MAAASMGHQTRISAAAAGTAIGSYTESHEYVTESLQKRMQIADTSGIRGSRSHPAERTRDSIYNLGGGIRTHATPAMLDLWLPRILGANESADVFALAETLPEFDVLVDRIARRFIYGACKVNRATFRARAGGMLELDLDLLGKTESNSATAFPSITAPSDPPYVFHDAVATFVSSARTIMEIEIIVDNAINARFSNSQTATDIHSTDRIVLVNFITPYTSDEVDLYGINTGGAAAATVVFTNGNYSTTFTFAKVQVPDNSPVVEQRGGEIVLRHQGVAKMSSTTRELVVTHDSVG